MSDEAAQAPDDAVTIDVGHVVVGPYQEDRWPFQWIAYCTDKATCGVGIRTNSESDADRFMRDNCRHYRGTEW